jgi:pteridine reductase
MDLHGKIALVTGGARRVGRAISLALAKAGCDVGIHFNRSAGDARALAAEVRSLGRRAEAFQADLANPEQVESLFRDFGGAFGRLDVLVNNAGLYDRTPIDSLTAQQWDAEFAVNARAPALCISRGLPLMGEGGTIINITDISVDRPRADYPAYCASKAALLALTRSCAKALAGRGIRVNAVAPGVALWPEDVSEPYKQELVDSVPMKRAGSPDDVAEAIVFLARQDYITGQQLRVDGGWCMT